MREQRLVVDVDVFGERRLLTLYEQDGSYFRTQYPECSGKREQEPRSSARNLENRHVALSLPRVADTIYDLSSIVQDAAESE